MKIDTYDLNRISHCTGQAIIEISLTDGLVSKLALIDKLRVLSEETEDKKHKYYYSCAIEIINKGSLSNIEFTDNINPKRKS